MPRFLLVLALLATLATIAVSGEPTLIHECISIPSTLVSKTENRTITFPSSTALPPALRSLKLQPDHIARDLYIATSPYFPDAGTATFTKAPEKATTLDIFFSTPYILIFLKVRSTSRRNKLAVSGTALHLFPRPFAMQLHRSRRSVRAAVAALTRALDANPNGPRLVTVVDHAAAAASVGLNLPDSSVVVFGNPAIGSQLWTRAPAIGVELPLEILIASSPLGVVYVGWNTASLLRFRFGLADLRPPVNTVLDTIDGVLATLAGVAANREFSPARGRFDIARIPKRNGIKLMKSKGDAVKAFSRLITALEAAPPVGIAFQIKHDVAAMNAGLPTGGKLNRVVVFGNPSLGTGIMQRAFAAAIDLPVKMGVWTTRKGASRYRVGYTTPEWIGLRHHVQVPEMLSTALANFASVALEV